MLAAFLLAGTVSVINAQQSLPELCAQRREALMKKAGGGVVVIPGSLRNPYGQNDISTSRYFYYLTGWEAPGAWVIIEPGARPRTTLFVTPTDPSRMTWNNREAGLGEAMTVYGADTSYPVSAFREKAQGILGTYDTIWTLRSSKFMYEALSQVIPEGKNHVIADARTMLNELRVIKDAYEIRMLREAINVTAEAQRQAMMLAAPGRFEYELEAAIDHTFRSKGCDGPGFTTIVGSGANSTILHYDENSKELVSGDVIVMDIGAEMKGYKADITRTVPVSGKFTKEQLDIYNLVLRAQKEAIKEMVPGRRTLGAHDRATGVIMKGLYDLGLVTDTTSKWQENLYTLYICTHYIGLDIHDLLPFNFTRQDESVFKPGMVITIEPGIYFHEEMMNSLAASSAGTPEAAEIDAFIKQVGPLFEKYKNTGVRIEDDILITPAGHEVLSAGAPKEPRDVEKLMKRKSRYE
jgi:Xaa-Pro aminopeptidase